MSELAESDLALVRWVADQKNLGAPLPEPYDRPYGTNPLVQHLVDIGVVHSVYAGMPLEDAARAATADCREWLAAHPDVM